MNRINAWTTYNQTQLKAVDKFADQYKVFLDNSKTEREAIDTIVNEIEAAGYRELNTLIGSKTKLKKGDKVYSVWMNKSIAMFQIGSDPLEAGMNILGAHIDSPRLDVKQNPLYEDGGFAYLDTHYYGGIKKYQYVAMPLAIHGVVVKKDGTTVQLNVGEDEDDPVFFVSDLLIHLAQDQMSKKASEVVAGEALDLIVGNRPFIIDSKPEKEENVVNEIKTISCKPITPSKFLKWEKISPEKENTLIYHYDVSKKYIVTPSKEKRTIYVQYNSCLEDPAYTIQNWFSDIASELKTGRYNTVVFDLRYNQGGQMSTQIVIDNELWKYKSEFDKCNLAIVTTGLYSALE